MAIPRPEETSSTQISLIHTSQQEPSKPPPADFGIKIRNSGQMGSVSKTGFGNSSTKTKVDLRSLVRGATRLTRRLRRWFDGATVVATPRMGLGSCIFPATLKNTGEIYSVGAALVSTSRRFDAMKNSGQVMRDVVVAPKWVSVPMVMMN